MLVLLFTSILTHSQDVKVKSGKILLDGKEIGLISDKKQVYTFSSLDGKALFTTQQKSKSLIDGSTENWLVVTDLSDNKTNDLTYNKIYFMWSYEKNLISILAYEDKKFLTPNGIDEKALKDFVNGDKIDMNAILDKKNEQIKLDSEQSINLYNSNKITINKKGDIIKQDTLRIGSVSRTVTKLNGFADILTYNVYDSDKNLIGEWQSSGAGVNPVTNGLWKEQLVLEKKKSIGIKYNTSGTSNLESDINARNIVAMVMFQGYKLGHHLNVEKGIASKEASPNIVFKKGYLINEKGEKLEGKITFMLGPDLNDPMSGGGMADLDADSYGKKVQYLEPKKNSSDYKSHTYKSKDGVRFCVENKENTQCYLGLKITGLTNLEKYTNLTFDTSLFYQILLENENAILLVNPVNSKELIIKIKKQEKGLYLNNVLPDDKFLLNANQYFDCSNLKFEAIDLKSIEGIYKVIENYNKTCSLSN
jgi:hypothetical protein